MTAGVADDPEDRKYYCDTIADEADHMNKLVMQLLNLSGLNWVQSKLIARILTCMNCVLRLCGKLLCYVKAAA